VAQADLASEVIASIRAVFAPVGVYLALVTRNNPYSSAASLLDRPDTAAVIADAFAEARSHARQAVQSAWYEHAPVTETLLGELLADVDHAYSAAALAHLRAEIHAAYSSVPPAEFVSGVTPPGINPGREAADARAQAVQDAVENFARWAGLRSSLSADVASGNARTLAQLESAGPGLRKRWRTSKQPPGPKTCYWCRKLNGVTIPLHESFASFLGGPVDLTGHGHLTQPPHLYHGWLQGPKLHPHCQCHVELVPGDEEIPVPQGEGIVPAPSGFVSAAEVQAMPEGRYRALVEFLRAAAHELGQVLERLGRLVHGR